MIILLKLGLVVLFILILIRLKIDLGLVLFSGAVLGGFLLGMNFRQIVKNIYSTLIDLNTLNLIGIILLVLYLGNFLQHTGNFKNMVNALDHLIPEPRLTLILPAAIIGLLPMLGGALISAPMIDESSQKMNLTSETKTFFNYWFRHIWEYFWPLYPGLILAAAIIKIPVSRIMIVQFPFTILAVVIGLILLFTKVPRIKKKSTSQRYVKSFVILVISLWPIILALILIFLLRFPMILSLAIVSLLTVLFSKSNIKEKKDVFLKSLSFKIIFLLASVMMFKRILVDSGVFTSILKVFGTEGLSAIILLFCAPFLIGFLTGVNHAYVGVSFPILLPIFGMENPDLIYIMFAYVSGFAGILLSPTHLCLNLTIQYFKADQRKVYKILFWPVLTIFLTAFLVLLFTRIV
ncbi:MAG: DUF401 family protein [Candidatus Aminicenantia bacterium]